MAKGKHGKAGQGGGGDKDRAGSRLAENDADTAAVNHYREDGGEEDEHENEEKFERWSSHFSSHVEVEVLGRKLTLQQDPSEGMLEETGSTVWDIGRVLALFLDRDRELSRRIKGKRIIELGSGSSPFVSTRAGLRWEVI